MNGSNLVTKPDPYIPVRMRENPLRLLLRTIGGPAAIAAKLVRACHVIACLLIPGRVEARLHRLHALGLVERPPTRWQLVFGSIDMFRFFIVPCAADYYRSKNITFGFHALLRWFDDPASMMDPTGLLSPRDTIIGHLLQVTHADPLYDLQLLEAHRDGLDALERQIEAMLAGTHPRAASIGAIIEDPTYHARLLDYVREYRARRHERRMVRENIENNPEFEALALVFGDLRTAMEYFASLPEAPLLALARLVRTPRFAEAQQAPRLLEARGDA